MEAGPFQDKVWGVGRAFIFLPGTPRQRPVLGESSYNSGFRVYVAVAVAPWSLEAGAQIGLEPDPWILAFCLTDHSQALSCLFYFIFFWKL